MRPGLRVRNILPRYGATAGQPDDRLDHRTTSAHWVGVCGLGSTATIGLRILKLGQ